MQVISEKNVKEACCKLHTRIDIVRIMKEIDRRSLKYLDVVSQLHCAILSVVCQMHTVQLLEDKTRISCKKMKQQK